MNAQHKLQNLLNAYDIKLNGHRPFDIQVHQPKALRQIYRDPSLGAGESYMAGAWDCEQLEEIFFRITRHFNAKQIYPVFTLLRFLIKYFLTNQQSRWRSKIVAKQHYDLSNELYQAMLGETMAYTCGYWRSAKTLDEAQRAKYDLVCKKLELMPGERVLELGCGFGGFAKFAATHYGVSVTAVNISEQQMQFAKTFCKDLPVELYVTDYRNIDIYNPQSLRFDKVVSIGMCEHVGEKNYRQFLKIAHQNLKDTGLFLMHTIGKNQTAHFTDPWIRKYIFPNGALPSVKQIAENMEDFFVLEDLHNFGFDYYRTLMAWFDNFQRYWDALQSTDTRFYRMWKYYLLSCAGAFRSRSMQLWQFVMSPQGKLNGYQSIR